MKDVVYLVATYKPPSSYGCCMCSFWSSSHSVGPGLILNAFLSASWFKLQALP